MKTSGSLVVSVILVSFVAAACASAQPLERSNGGTLACPGFHSLAGDEVTSFAWAFRNFNSDQTLTITGVTLYDESGTAVKTMPAPDAFPAGFNSALGPHQTSVLNTQAIFGGDFPGLLQAIVTWSADGKGFDLYAHIVRIVRGEDLGETRATGLLRCVTLR
jgi:hypothetical protein